VGLNTLSLRHPLYIIGTVDEKNDAKWNTMSGSDKVIQTVRDKCDTEQRRKIALSEFLKEVSRECADHLSWVASARDEQWEEAEKSGDLRIA
jgi:hypothetical protein